MLAKIRSLAGWAALVAAGVLGFCIKTSSYVGVYIYYTCLPVIIIGTVVWWLIASWEQKQDEASPPVSQADTPAASFQTAPSDTPVTDFRPTAPQKSKSGIPMKSILYGLLAVLLVLLIVLCGLFIAKMAGGSDDAVAPAASAVSATAKSTASETDNPVVGTEAAASAINPQTEVESLRTEVADLRGQLDKKAEEKAQFQADVERLVEKQAKCEQVAKNLGYYESVSGYCDLEPHRDRESFSRQFSQLECWEILDEKAIQALVQTSSDNALQAAENAPDYVGFCRKEYPFWSKLDKGLLK
ncbi:hypothetical protein BG910_06100 [Neisseria chenwenguii]|uniref:Uncharacterized protein n=1 Tax=Neisseria chenwenguii TaxID=1853278 RepID=A0A220S1Y4_9NEIS|nr:hypothetical protein [Neisseria chenwenguii]ASK27368.1 hypothetical protein BG910_06100 [Neisseria chenwenguii]